MENSHNGYVEEVYLEESISTDGHEVIIEHAEESILWMYDTLLPAKFDIDN